MKNFFLLRFSAVVALVAIMGSFASAQNLNMPSGTATWTAGVEFTPGSSVFYDNGGAAGDYSASFGGTVMICPAAPLCAQQTPGTVSLTFTAFAFELSCAGCTPWDALGINGDALAANNGVYSSSIAAPFTTAANVPTSVSTSTALNALKAATGGNTKVMTANKTFTSAPGGCLTVIFGSDSSGQLAGFAANMNAVAPTGSCGGGGGAAVECLLVCSGDQNITLPSGACEYQVPNFVTMAGPCMDGAVVPPPVVGFSGAFAYANRWFFNTANGSDPAYGNLPCTNIAGLPGTLVLESADVLSGGNTCSWFGTLVAWRVPANGTISFNWATQTNDPTWDHFGYSLTNDPNTPTGMFGTTLQASTIELASTTASGTISIPVTAGQIFSLVNRTDDGTGGALTATINNFMFQAVTVPAPWVIRHVCGPKAGDLLTAGSYTSCYELVNPAGQVVDDCCFDMNVAGFPNPTRSLVANDQVNVSLDDDGWSLVTTDMILEGGPYGCYDGYLMRRNPVVSGTPPTQALTIPLATNPAYPGYTYGGVWVNCSDIGKRIEVEVLDPVTGNRAWGYVNVEDKIAPVVTCSCQDITTLSPLAPFTGAIANTDPTFVRPTGTAACAAGTNVSFYETHTLAVSVTGNYTFNAANSAGDTYAILYQAPFNPADPCANFIIANDDTAGGLDPLFTTALTAGVQYVYVMTTFGANSATGAYTVAVTGPGQFLTNPSNAPECQFACYDIEIVKRETVGMLYNIPGLNANKSK